MSQIGHNSGAKVGGIAEEALQSYVDRIERLEEEKAALASDIKDVYGEAKAVGFDVKILRKVIQRRRMQEHDREEMDELIDLYERALLGELLSE